MYVEIEIVPHSMGPTSAKSPSAASGTEPASQTMKSLHPEVCPDPLRELSPIIYYVQSMRDQPDDSSNASKKPHIKSSAFKDLKNESCVKSGDGFCLAVSLQDGTIIYVSSTITPILGYSKDMLLGQCIMNFLYPRDRITFANHLSQGLNSRFNEDAKGMCHNRSQSTFLCRLRQYQSLKFGYGISDKKVQYKPFQMSVYIKDVIVDDVSVENASTAMCLIVTAVSIQTAYRVPNEIPAMTCFSTRHTASCHFSHVDLSAAVYLGYLPQDMLGHSVFDFYCMEDLSQLKDIYELVIKEQGHSFRSKPYRFKAFNGSFVILETEWSCFINPWTRKLEFVVGQHRVLKGPNIPNVFMEASRDNPEIRPASEEVLNNNRHLQEQIKDILSQPVKPRESNHLRQRSNKRRKELASFVSTLVDEMSHKRIDKGEEQLAIEGCTCSDQGSVVMGEISPHQELHDSDPSSESPPNIQEIRYQENIERFFASHPKTNLSESPGEMKLNNAQIEHENRDEENCKATASPESFENKSTSDFALNDSNYGSGGGGSGSGGGGSNGSGSNGGSGGGSGGRCLDSKRKHSSVTTGDSGNESLTVKEQQTTTSSSCGSRNGSAGGDSTENNYPPCPPLTEEVLLQHNRMAHKHVKHPAPDEFCAAKDNYRFKRSGSPPVNSVLHKHTKPSRDGVDGSTAASAPFTPLMHAASLVTSQPDNVAAFMPNLAIPTYTYVPLNSTQTPANTPFLIPVMYVGGVPLYPSLSTMEGTQSKGMWQCGALPLMPMWQQTSVGSQELPKQEKASSGGNVCSDKPTEDGLRKQDTSDKTLPNLKDGGGVPCGDVDGGSNRAFKQYATKYSVGPVPGLAGSKDKKAEDLNNHEGSDKDTQQDDSVSLSFESSFFGKSENSESQFSSEKSSEDTDTEMKIRRRRHPMRGTLREPHWTEGVNLSADLVYRYQLRAADLADVLKSDMDKLQRLQQPRLVNEQLSVLQHELEDREDLDEATAGGDDLRPKDQDIASSQGLTAAQNCACMYAMEEDLTEEMEELERRMLSSIDPDY
ncbi:unnamed protein product [Ixodes pacificus]